MPVSFVPGPHPTASGRRSSASSPFPTRIKTSLPPSSYPSRLQDHESPLQSDTPARQSTPDDPFGPVDTALSAEAYERLTSSPQEEHIQIYPEMYDRERDPEMQPLLSPRTTRQRVGCSIALGGITVVILVLVFVIGGWKLGKGTGGGRWPGSPAVVRY